ncbi:MAG: relaxase/mobilization nuclease domain-containing protein [Desulfovibrio sp.]|nr:relaxase/mobilization nuclease domain-containing protein [Desulfovibrio sp.]
MIIKVIEHKTQQTESDAEALVRYVKGERGMDEDVEKLALGYGGQLNFDTSVTNRQLLLLKELMRETGSRRPLMHAVIAWEEGERPTPEQVREAVQIWIKEVRLKGLATLWEVHENTACMHAHVVVCLVDPMTGAWRDPTFYKRDSQKAKAIIEKRQGWRPCAEDVFIPDPAGPGIMPNPERGRRKKGPDLPPLRQGAAAMEQRTGVKSAQTTAQEEVGAILEAADGWQSFHSLLAESGMQYVPAPRGGFKFIVDGKEVRASSVMRKCSKKIEEALGGPYEAPAQDVPAPAPPPAEPEPAAGMDSDMLPFWRRYLAEEAAWKEDCRRASQTAREEWKLRTKAVLEENRRIRKTIRTEIRQAERLVRKARRQGGAASLPEWKVAALRLALEDRGRARLQPLPPQGRSGRPTWPSFADWLEDAGEADLAERWRRRVQLAQERAEDAAQRREIDSAIWTATHLHWAAPGM